VVANKIAKRKAAAIFNKTQSYEKAAGSSKSAAFIRY